MKVISYAVARDDLAATMQMVCDDQEPVIITRKRDRDQAVVMMPLSDYESMQETSYLCRSPANAERLDTAIGQLESGQGKERVMPQF